MSEFCGDGDGVPKAKLLKRWKRRPTQHTVHTSLLVEPLKASGIPLWRLSEAATGSPRAQAKSGRRRVHCIQALCIRSKSSAEDHCDHPPEDPSWIHHRATGTKEANEVGHHGSSSATHSSELQSKPPQTAAIDSSCTHLGPTGDLELTKHKVRVITEGTVPMRDLTLPNARPLPVESGSSGSSKLRRVVAVEGGRSAGTRGGRCCHGTFQVAMLTLTVSTTTGTVINPSFGDYQSTFLFQVRDSRHLRDILAKAASNPTRDTLFGAPLASWRRQGDKSPPRLLNDSSLAPTAWRTRMPRAISPTARSSAALANLYEPGELVDEVVDDVQQWYSGAVSDSIDRRRPQAQAAQLGIALLVEQSAPTRRSWCSTSACPEMHLTSRPDAPRRRPPISLAAPAAKQPEFFLLCCAVLSAALICLLCVLGQPSKLAGCLSRSSLLTRHLRLGYRTTLA
ncbi:hypothetical protein G7046_g937 [Stylonectria norvegica]|nr:hypothetical protein G7046_g937 [Stylonectria norvegica]